MIERFGKSKENYHSSNVRSFLLKKLEKLLSQYEKEKNTSFNKKDIALSVMGVSGALMADLLMDNKKITEKDLRKISDKVILILIKQYE